MKSIPVILTLAAILLPLATLATEKPRPNVLFISIDDLNDMPTFMGRYPDAITPNMDRLASKGMVFTRAHSPYPLCGPARACVMTSTLASTHGFNDHISDEKVQPCAGLKIPYTFVAFSG
jgi:arylsulfatase A-like enzyme